MKYERTRQQFYENELCQMISQLAELLDRGYSVEIGKSRSGLKIFSISKKHIIVRRENLNE